MLGVGTTPEAQEGCIEAYHIMITLVLQIWVFTLPVHTRPNDKTAIYRSCDDNTA